MPKIKCIGNGIINLSGIPAVDQYLLISDTEYDQFTGNVNTEILYEKMKIVAKCPNCGRLHVFWNGFDKSQTIYKLDNG